MMSTPSAVVGMAILNNARGKFATANPLWRTPPLKNANRSHLRSGTLVRDTHQEQPVRRRRLAGGAAIAGVQRGSGPFHGS